MKTVPSFRQTSLLLGIIAALFPLSRTQAQNTPITIPLHHFIYSGEQRLAIYVGVNGGRPHPYLFDTGSSVFEAVVTTNGPYDPSHSIPGITEISGVDGDHNDYPDFAYSYGDGAGFSGTLVQTSVSLYADTNADSQPLITFTNAAGGTNGLIINAIADHYKHFNTGEKNPEFWKDISNGIPPIEDHNIYGTFGAGPFVSDIRYLVDPTNNTNFKRLSNGITYGSVIGQVITTGYIVDVTSSNPSVTIGLNTQNTFPFAGNTVPANPPTNPNTLTFPGSGTPSFDSGEVTLNEVLSGKANTTRKNQALFLTNISVLLDTGTADFNAQLDTSNAAQNSFVNSTAASTNIFAGNSFSATAGGLPVFSITTSETNATDNVGIINNTIGIGVFLQDRILFDLQDGLVGFQNPLLLPPPPQYDHIVVVILENHGYDEVLGAQLPFINNVLRSGGADITNSFSLQHPSQPNYYWLFSGSNQGVACDYTPPTFSSTSNRMAPFTSAPNLYTELKQVGKTFGGYLDAYPGPKNVTLANATVANVKYVCRHVPWLGFSNVPANVTRNFTTFGTTAASFAKLPTVSFVIPGLEHDMHDYALGKGVSDVTNSAIAMTNADLWLSTYLGAYAQWAVTNNSLLIVTTDEDSTADWPTPPNSGQNYSGSNPVALTAPDATYSATGTNPEGTAQTGPNQVTTLFYGANVVPGAYGEGYGITHVNLLRTIEWLCGITHGAGAQSSAVTTIGETPVTDIFAGFAGADNFAGKTPDTNKWIVNVDQSSSNDVLQQNNGLRFLVPVSDSNNLAAWAWTTNAPTTSDWSATLNVSNLASSKLSNAFAGIGLTARNPSDPQNNGFSSSLAYDRSAGGVVWQASLDQGTNVSPTLKNIPSTTSKGSVLLTYTAATQTLTAAYSTAPATKGTTWISLNSVTLDELSMATNNPDANTFFIAIYGSSSGFKLGTTGGLSAGNFSISGNATATSQPKPALLIPHSPATR